MRRLVTSVFFLMALATPAQERAHYQSQVWQPDLGNGMYKNPVLHADYSDPDVIRVGNDYYMTSSSFNASPALPILHSTDMVNWQLVNHALPLQVPENVYDKVQHGKGVWAPCMRYHHGWFYIFWGDPDYGIYRVKTQNPLERWESPVLIMPGKGLIDPSPLWDDDGNAYLVHAYAASRTGVKSLLSVVAMDSSATKVLGPSRHVFDGHDHHKTIEGPKFHKRNGYYYIFAPAGGVSTGWQLVLRSRTIYGPYEEKIVLAQGETPINGPHQGAWVETPQGQSWFYHFQDKGAYGRVVHLQPMSWKNDWPIIGVKQNQDNVGSPALVHKKPQLSAGGPSVNPAESDHFKGPDLGLQWQWQGNRNVLFYAKLPGNEFLRLFALPAPEQDQNLFNAPHLLLQKFPAPSFKAITKITLHPEDALNGKQAGLIVMGTDYATFSLHKEEKGYILKQTKALNASHNQPEVIVASLPIKTNSLFLKIEVQAPDALCRFSFSEDGKNFRSFGDPFQAKPGKWIGAKIGLFCTSDQNSKSGGYADVDFFEIIP